MSEDVRNALNIKRNKNNGEQRDNEAFRGFGPGGHGRRLEHSADRV
jgi:hypothetical protein